MRACFLEQGPLVRRFPAEPLIFDPPGQLPLWERDNAEHPPPSLPEEDGELEGERPIGRGREEAAGTRSRGSDARAPGSRELAQAIRRLEQAYRLLRPGLRDPEKLALRYYRVQGRAAWILTNCRRLLPEDTVYRLQSRLGAPVLSSPFDETLPSHRAVLRLRQTTRELLDAVLPALEHDPGGEAWDQTF